MNRRNDNSKKKRIGWFCSYVPEEIIMAAGLEPVRLKGRVKNIEEADAHIFSNLCPYLKNILDSGLRNKFGEIEGIIFTNACDGMHRLADLWTQYIQTPFTYMLEIPKNRDDQGIKYFAAQFLELKKGLEDGFSVKISADRLGQAISLMNKRREMMMALFDGQKETRPRYRGSELLALCMEETAGPKDETTGKIKEFSGHSKTSNHANDKSPRILVMGNLVDAPILFRMVENAGAAVVAFDTCNSLKHYSDPVDNGSSPIESLARRYLLKPPCARAPGFDTRIARLRRLIDEYSIDGVIVSSIKFCDYSLFEAPQIQGFLKKGGPVPLVVLENDYVWSDEGRIRTRVEAFVEMLMGQQP
jgi:benzoyl-CoA reductase subunit C